MELLAINNNHHIEDISFEEMPTITNFTSTDKPFIQV